MVGPRMEFSRRLWSYYSSKFGFVGLLFVVKSVFVGSLKALFYILTFSEDNEELRDFPMHRSVYEQMIMQILIMCKCVLSSLC